MARTQTAPATAPKAPDLIAWHVTQKGEKSYWNKCGACWQHKDKKGLTLQLEVLPINGRIVLRQPSEEASAEGGQK